MLNYTVIYRLSLDTQFTVLKKHYAPAPAIFGDNETEIFSANAPKCSPQPNDHRLPSVVSSDYSLRGRSTVSIFEIEIDKSCLTLARCMSKSKIENHKGCSTMSIFMPISVFNFSHEIDKASSTLREIEIEIDKLINIK
jgi:hypothetical protein